MPEFITHANAKEEEKKMEKDQIRNKLNINQIYNKSIEEDKTQNKLTIQPEEEQKILSDFQQLFSQEIIDYNKLCQLAWNGIPKEYRSESWKLLLKYTPTNRAFSLTELSHKRKLYLSYLKLYFSEPFATPPIVLSTLSSQSLSMYEQIQKDVTRTSCPLQKHFSSQQEKQLFWGKTILGNPKIQMVMSQVLFTWHEKHPTPGYFQGINDLIVPFLIMFINEYVQIDFATLTAIGHIDKMTENDYESLTADVYFCVSQLIDMIYQNYLDSQIATAEALNKIASIVKKIDSELSLHLEKEAEESGITIQQIYTTLLLDWIFCLLLRVFPLNLSFTLFDTYLADQKQFPILHIYVCVSLLLKWSAKLKTMNLQEINLFIQNLPMHTWNTQHVRMLVQEAFVFQSLYETSQAHLKKKDKSEEEQKSGSASTRSQPTSNYQEK